MDHHRSDTLTDEEPLAGERGSRQVEAVRIAGVYGQCQARSTERSKRRVGSGHRCKTDTSVLDGEPGQVQVATQGLSADACLRDRQFDHAGLSMIGQTNGHFRCGGVGEVQGTGFHVHGFVIDAVGLKAGHHGVAAHHGEASIRIVEHHIGAVENSPNQHAR